MQTQADRSRLSLWKKDIQCAWLHYVACIVSTCEHFLSVLLRLRLFYKCELERTKEQCDKESVFTGYDYSHRVRNLQ